MIDCKLGTVLPTQIEEFYSHIQWSNGNRSHTYPKMQDCLGQTTKLLLTRAARCGNPAQEEQSSPVGREGLSGFHSHTAGIGTFQMDLLPVFLLQSEKLWAFWGLWGWVEKRSSIQVNTWQKTFLFPCFNLTFINFAHEILCLVSGNHTDFAGTCG